MKLLNKGAMFGLDARIALAIFGALSVISGAALYSAIKSAQAESKRQNLVELVKASEAYYLDNGVQITLDTTGGVDKINISELVVNTQSFSTWNGPYTEGSTPTPDAIVTGFSKRLHEDMIIAMSLRQASTWTEMNDADTDEKCTSGSGDCTEWVVVIPEVSSANAAAIQLFNDLDAAVDNGDGALAGKVRQNSAFNFVYYQGIPRKKP